jgi:hypothetical protein
MIAMIVPVRGPGGRPARGSAGGGGGSGAVEPGWPPYGDPGYGALGRGCG